MRILNIAFAISLLVLFSGCDSISRHQYIVTKATVEDRDFVRATAFRISTSARMSPIEAPGVERVEWAFRENVRNFPVILGARLVDDALVIDLCCFHPGPPSHTGGTFVMVDAEFTPILSGQFGSRLRKDPIPPVPFTSKLPNQALEPTSPAVTPRADARVAPAGDVAHL